jgi:hypothetical protein
MTDNERSSDAVLAQADALVAEFRHLVALQESGATPERINERAGIFCAIGQALIDDVNAEAAPR